MIRYSNAVQSYLEALPAFDKDRILPILEMVDQSGDEILVQYYKPNILFFSVRGMLAWGLSPRKKYLSFYAGSYETAILLQKKAKELGVSSQGAGCYRFNKLANINMPVLRELLKQIYQSEHTGAGNLMALQ